jgi:hypothetical protein
MFETTEAIVEQFDVGLKYKQHYAKCADQGARPVEPDWKGFSQHKMLSADLCRHLRNKLDMEDKVLLERDFKLDVLGHIFKVPEVDQAIVNALGSEYMPLWVRWYKNDPAQVERPPSFYWHCDGGPTKHAKILLYLNSSEESGGNTQFLSKQTTDGLKQINYMFCNINERKEEVESLCTEWTLPYKMVEREIAEGEGVVFEPFNIGHKGIWPTKAPRYLMQICILPAARPWYVEVSQRNIPRGSNAWPTVT